MFDKFDLKSDFKPTGDQPEAIKQLLEGIDKGLDRQTLLGVTGSGKTFTMANVIQQLQKPALVIAHNKTLAAQLAQEFEEFFPDNAVHYFVSYYDYYQPEAYMPATDTYIEKDASINEDIDRLRHATTQALLTRKDVIIVASVSCIYGLGSPEEYKAANLLIQKGGSETRRDVIEKLIHIHFERTNADLKPGTFRSVGTVVEVMPTSAKVIYRIEWNDAKIDTITEMNAITYEITREKDSIMIFPAKHFITDGEKKEAAMKSIQDELDEQLAKMNKEGKLLEAERLKRRTQYDLAMIREVGYTGGIENYSRHLSGKNAGEPPETLLSYFPKNADGSADFITFIDESHVTLPQIGGMFAGDQSRKGTLIEHGFRLPSAADNRPLKRDEFNERVGQMIFVSATPGKEEHETSQKIVEQVIRPTGLVDPMVEIRPAAGVNGNIGQIHDFVAEAVAEIQKGNRVLATTLTKRMAEDLASFLKEKKMKAEYLHSDVETLDRIKILTKLRRGEIDCLVGVNLLREGLDLPEVTLIGILDADKQGFLRSETSLIQTIGRAARNIDGRVILYADVMTDAMKNAISETTRRRNIQLAYNEKHGITPQTIKKEIRDITSRLDSKHEKAVLEELGTDLELFAKKPKALLKIKNQQMKQAVEELDFETAALVRDQIHIIKEKFGLLEGDGKKKTKKPVRRFKR